MASRSLLDGIKAGRLLPAALATTWAVLTVLGGKLWADTAWRDNATTPQGLARQAVAELAVERRPSPARLAAAEQLVRGELWFGPYRSASWCRLAYIQFLRAGRLDATTAESLRRSYRVAPFDTESFLWRTQFIFEYWDQVPADLKGSALNETRAYYSSWSNRRQIEMMAARVDNPAGRLALQLILLQAPLPA